MTLFLTPAESFHPLNPLLLQTQAQRVRADLWPESSWLNLPKDIILVH